MRRILVITLSTVILLSFTSCGNKNKESIISHKVLDIKPNYDFFDLAASREGHVYISDKDKIHIVNKEGLKIDEITDSLDFCRIISYDNNKIYAYDDFDNCIQIYDMNNNLIAKQNINITGFLSKMKVYESNIFLLQSDKENYKNRYLTIYNIETEEYNTLQFTNVISFSLFQDNTIILLLDSHTSDNIIIWDYKENKASQELSKPISASNIEYSKNDGKIYFIEGDIVKQLNIEENEWNSLLSTNDVMINKIALNDNICFLSDKENKLHIFNMDSYSTNLSNNITVISSNPAIDRDTIMKKALNDFNKKQPDVNVKFKFIDFEKYNIELIKKFNSGDNSFDIFYISADNSINYIKHEAMADLSTFPQINVLFEKMYDGIQDLCSYNGRIVGIPWNIYFPAMEVNEQLFNKLEQNYTLNSLNWNDMYELAQNCKMDLDGDGTHDTYCLEYNKRSFGLLLAELSCSMYFDQFEGTASFDNSDFKNLLVVYKKLWKENLILEKEDYSTHSDKKDNILFYPSDKFNTTSGKWTYMPILGEKRAYPVSITFLSVNNRSRNQMLSAELLSSISSQSHPYRLPLLVNDPNNQMNEENEEIYKNILKFGVKRSFNSDLYVFITETLQEYLNDEITIEKTINLINSKALMIANE